MANMILVNEVQSFARPVHEVHATAANDRCLIGLPLSHGDTQVTYQGRVLWQGPVYPGTIGFLAPLAQLRTIVKISWASMRLSVPLDLLDEVATDLELETEKPRFVTKPYKDVVLLSRQLQHVSRFDHLHRQLFVDGIARSLLACFSRGCRSRVGKAKEHVRTLTQKELARCIEFADAHTHMPLSLADWSGVLELSEAEFSRRFRIRTGKSPYRWFLDRRLDRAKDELRDENLNLVDIAQRFGFSSQSHFSEAFRRYTGFTPGRWRATHAR